jgi:2-polyprenyl-3-methyl-5-hydroxy-6-metoxy-1,4-benzoquinol methylase
MNEGTMGVVDRARAIECPICGGMAFVTHNHPDAHIYQCPQCTHRFSELKPNVSEPYAPEYFEETHSNYFSHPNLWLYDLIARLIEREPEPRSLIDVGCGTGSLLQFLKARVQSVELTGIDVAAPPLPPGIEFIQGDVVSLELHRQFSIVVTLAAIEHIADCRGFARRLKSLAKPGALVVVMTLNEDSTLYAAARLLHKLGFQLPFNRLYSSHHIHHFSEASLRALLVSEGLSVEKAISYNPKLAAVDIPAPNRAVNLALRAAVGGLFVLGSIANRCYLQVLICRNR